MNRPKTINLDITSRCTLGCSGCDRVWYKNNGKTIPKHDLSLEEFDKISNYFEKVLFCGQISDPIFNPHFIDMLKMCYEKNVDVQISTAASHRPEEWYVKAFEANPKAKWIFGLDGFPKDSHKYRINQDGEKLFKIMKLGTFMGINVVWQYIVFDYNEDDQFLAYDMAKKNGMEFLLIESSRFDDDAKHLKPEVSYTEKQRQNDFNPKCLDGTKEYGWDYMGRMLPCCWFWQTDNKHLSFSELTKDKFHISNIDRVEDVINSKEWIEFHRMLKENPENAPDICKKHCGVRGGKTSTKTLMNEMKHAR